jgi:hypothetical protein
VDRKPAPIVDSEARAARIAWWASFFATVALIAILGVAKSAQAATVAAAGDPGASAAAHSPIEEFEAEEEGEEEFEAEECEEGEEGEEECEEGEEAGSEAPEECVLSSADATVFAFGAEDKVRLVIRYAALSPTVVAVDYGFHGSRGSLYLGQSQRHFGRTGVFSQTETLSEPQMARAMGAKDFAVQLYAVDAPHYCRHFFDRQLTIRHAAPSGLIWSDPESSFRR